MLLTVTQSVLHSKEGAKCGAAGWLNWTHQLICAVTLPESGKFDSKEDIRRAQTKSNRENFLSRLGAKYF